MRDAQPAESHILRFAFVALLVSLAMGVSLIAIGWMTSSAFVLGLSSTLLVGVPALSLIIAAVGAPLQRKLVYILVILAFLLVFDLIAYVSGLQSIATGSAEIEGALTGIAVMAYRLILTCCPFVAVVLFAGKRTDVFWTSGGSPGKPA